MQINKIPNIYPHNHAANLLPLSNGEMLCAWFGGSCEGKSDIVVHVSRFVEGKSDWSAPQILSDDLERSEQNPILFEVKPGVLWLIYTAQIGIFQDTAVVRWRKSEDFGHTWSPVENLFDQTGIFVRNPPVRLENGNIVLPAYYCLKSKTGFLGEDYSVVKLSSDDGKTWSEVKIDGSEGLVHMSLVRLDNGELVGYFRSRQADNIYMTRSTDHAESWTKPVPIELLNNNASIQCTKLRDGRLAMVFNDVNKVISPPKVNRPPWFEKSDMDQVNIEPSDKPSAVWGVARSPLMLAVSSDNGYTWTKVKALVTKEGYEGEPEFSYPSIKQTSDGSIHIAYTHLREYINHIVLSEEFE